MLSSNDFPRKITKQEIENEIKQRKEEKSKIKTKQTFQKLKSKRKNK